MGVPETRVLFAASEATPFVKSGGLGDVIGSLPQKLKDEGVDVRVVLPKYADIADRFKQQMKHICTYTVQVGWRNKYCGVWSMKWDGVTYYFIDNEHYFGRAGLYGYGDDAERFAFFSRAVLEALPHIGFIPHLLHAHDWQAGMIPVLLRAHYSRFTPYTKIKTIITVHNLKYQGKFSRGILQDVLGLSDDFFHADGLEYYGAGNCLKGGLVYSDYITTVSPTYAQEIQHDFFGEGLNGILYGKRQFLTGILNGIDVEQYDPAHDPHLEASYNRESMSLKVVNKQALQQQLGLPIRSEVPMIGMVTRLVEQKGIDLCMCVFSEIMKHDVQFVVVGTGDHRYEQFFREQVWFHPDKVSAQIRFDESLARRTYAASDLFLMPSLFEPCGLGQLIAMQYGAVPIVRETGGLKDTVSAYRPDLGEGTGFTFANYNAHDMLYTIRRALGFYQERAHWDRILQNIWRNPFNWEKSAKQYIRLYEQILTEPVPL